jgi:hypothetical protein
VVEEYFDLLFNEDTEVTGAASVRERPLPKGHRNSKRKNRGKYSFNTSVNSGSSDAASLSSAGASSDTLSSSVEADAQAAKSMRTGGEGKEGGSSSVLPPGDASVVSREGGVSEFPTILEDESGNDYDNDSDVDIDELSLRSSVAAVPTDRSSHMTSDLASAMAAATGEAPTPAPVGELVMSFTEFLRVNMRLAEDRVLSFVTVFSTGFGTKWIPGATFYYEPEVTFGSLLTQR